MCTSTPYYVVIPIPWTAADINVYNKCSTFFLGSPCNSGIEYCYDTAPSPVDKNCVCTPAVYNDSNVGTCGNSFSIYQYMGGDPTRPSVMGYQLIPSINGNYPINYSSLPILMQDRYANVPTGYNILVEGKARQGYLILIYDMCWVQSWDDLYNLSPDAVTQWQYQNTESNYSNQNFFLFPDTVTHVPTIESQFATLLGIFCAKTSTTCTVNQPSCSNFFSAAAGQSGTGRNYCYDAYFQYLQGKNLYTGGNYQNAVLESMTQYCGQYTKNSPTECNCLNRKQIQDFNIFERSSLDQSPIGCWWYPCKDNTTYLIDSPTYNQAKHCPDICQAVFEIMGHNNINIENSNITQDLICCTNSKGTANTCCADPTQSSCTSSNTGVDFWKKYGLLIIITIIIILVLAVIFGVIIYQLRKK